MGTAALGAEVLKILPFGIGVLILVLCHSAHAFWLSRKAFQTGRPVWVRIKLHSLEFRIGEKGESKLDTLPQEGGKLEIAVESEIENTDDSVDDDEA